MAGVPGRDKTGLPGEVPNSLSVVDPSGSILQSPDSAQGKAVARVDHSATIDTASKTPVKTPGAYASIIEAPQREKDSGAGLSERLDLGKWAYDEVKCAPPLADPLALVQLYDRNVAHKACIDAKTANCVGLGWRLDLKEGREDEDVKQLQADVKKWLEGCARRDGKSMDELLGAVRKDEESVGWGGWEISRNGKGAPDGFFHVHAYTLRRRKDRDGWVQKWMGEYRHFRDYGRAAEDTANPERFEGTNEILMFFETTPTNPFYGHPDHLPALGDMLGDESAQAYQQQFFLNNAVPRLAICVNGGRLDPNTREYVVNYMREGLRGEAHKTMLLETEAGANVSISIEKLTVGASGREDASFIEYRKFCRDQVIMAHRVSPSKVTIVENANLANSKDQDLTFKEQVIKPDQQRYETRIQWLLEDTFGDDLPIEFKFNEMALSDEEQIARTRSYYQQALTVNEVREANDYGKAGIDADTGAVIDPELEEWGKRPFEITRGSNVGAFPGDTSGTGTVVPMDDLKAAMNSAVVAGNSMVKIPAGKAPTPGAIAPPPGNAQITKSWSEFRKMREMARDLGFVIEQVEEVFPGSHNIYKEDGVHELAEALALQGPPQVTIEKGAIVLEAPKGAKRTTTKKDFILNGAGLITGVRETTEED